MNIFVRSLLISILTLTVLSIDQTRVTSAFATTSSNNNNFNQRQRQLQKPHRRGFVVSSPTTTTNNNNIMGQQNQKQLNQQPPPVHGLKAESKAVASSTPPPPPSSPPKKRVRITALDVIRALLACHIVLGHFLRFANPPGECIIFLFVKNSKTKKKKIPGEVEKRGSVEA